MKQLISADPGQMSIEFSLLIATLSTTRQAGPEKQLGFIG